MSEEAVKALRARVEAWLRAEGGDAASPVGEVWPGPRSSEICFLAFDDSIMVTLHLRVKDVPAGRAGGLERPRDQEGAGGLERPRDQEGPLIVKAEGGS